MAEREQRKSPKAAHSGSGSGLRLTHDISLDEFEDEDLSEITEIKDERGLSLNCNGLDVKSHHVTRPSSSVVRRVEAGAVGRARSEMLHLELIDGAEGTHTGDAHSCATRSKDTHTTDTRTKDTHTMDTYRPKRPTTLNLFPQVPRTQDSLNNNSFGKKYSWQEKVSHSSSPQKTGDLTPPHEHICLSDEDKIKTKDCGTSTDTPTRRPAPSRQPPPSAPPLGPPIKTGVCEQHRERIRYPSDVCVEATEEIYLTPDRSGRMSVINDGEAPPPYRPPAVMRDEEEEEPPPSYASCVAASASLDLRSRRRRIKSKGRKGKEEEEQNDEDSRISSNGLTYDSVKYTLVVDEDAQLELVSLKECFHSYSDDSDSATVYDNCVSSPYGEDFDEEEEELGGATGARMGGANREATAYLSEDSTPEADIPFSRKFLNVFMNGQSRSSSAESFGVFSCVINGEERDQSHRAVYRFIPRHEDELELEVDDPLLVEVQADDFWYEGYNMRTGARGVFPAYYAIEVSKESEPIKKVRSADWVERYRLKFLGSVQVPYHKGNEVLCAAMQKVANNRRLTLHYNPPSSCFLEINVKGVKLVVQDEYGVYDGSDQCSHFFQLKNISFCGYHPKNNKYFGFITKHPADQRFACHVFVSENSTKPLAEAVGTAFQLYYKEFVQISCPTEDIYLE